MCQAIWVPLKCKDYIWRYGIPIIKIKRSRAHVISIMGISILVRRHLYIETALSSGSLRKRGRDQQTGLPYKCWWHQPLHVSCHSRFKFRSITKYDLLNTLRPRQNGRHFAEDTCIRIFVNENDRISIEFSLKFVPKGPINNIPALVQKMAWRRPGDKPLSEPVMVSLLTYICVTRPQWVNSARNLLMTDWRAWFIVFMPILTKTVTGCNYLIW